VPPDHARCRRFRRSARFAPRPSADVPSARPHPGVDDLLKTKAQPQFERTVESLSILLSRVFSALNHGVSCLAFLLPVLLLPVVSCSLLLARIYSEIALHTSATEDEYQAKNCFGLVSLGFHRRINSLLTRDDFGFIILSAARVLQSRISASRS